MRFLTGRMASYGSAGMGAGVPVALDSDAAEEGWTLGRHLYALCEGNLDSWEDTIFYRAGAVYIAFKDD